MNPAADSGITYVVWRNYQRRAEVLSRELGANLLYIPHAFRSTWLRPLDYLKAFWVTSRALLRTRPVVVFFQSPPVFTALSAWLLRVPYVIDAHNATFQSRWGKLPGTRTLINGAALVLAHNDEIADLARVTFPKASIVAVRDPVRSFGLGVTERDPRKVLPICSFGPDEPAELLLQVFEESPDLTFYITGNLSRLPNAVQGKLRSMQNVVPTGFLSEDEYQRLLSSCGAALVLTTRESTQPSGACEALSSDTPLVLSRTSITEKLFGDWAHLVENDAHEITAALKSALQSRLDLEAERLAWNDAVKNSLDKVQSLISWKSITVQRRTE